MTVGRLLLVANLSTFIALSRIAQILDLTALWLSLDHIYKNVIHKNVCNPFQTTKEKERRW